MGSTSSRRRWKIIGRVRPQPAPLPRLKNAGDQTTACSEHGRTSTCSATTPAGATLGQTGNRSQRRSEIVVLQAAQADREHADGDDPPARIQIPRRRSARMGRLQPQFRRHTTERNDGNSCRRIFAAVRRPQLRRSDPKKKPIVDSRPSRTSTPEQRPWRMRDQSEPG